MFYQLTAKFVTKTFLFLCLKCTVMEACAYLWIQIKEKNLIDEV